MKTGEGGKRRREIRIKRSTELGAARFLAGIAVDHGAASTEFHRSIRRLTVTMRMKAFGLLGFLILNGALAVPALAQDWAKAKIEKSPRHLEWVKVKHGNREVNCFIAYPEVKEKATAVV